MIGIQAVTMSMTAIGNETTAISGDIASWTIDTELEFNEFKEMIERMFNIKKKQKNNSRSRISNSMKKNNQTLAIDETSQSMINTTMAK